MLTRDCIDEDATEVSTTMLAVGAESFNYDPRFESLEEAMRRMYRAMRFQEKIEAAERFLKACGHLEEG